MINRRGNTRLEWYDVDLLLWGSIFPPPTEDRSRKPWLWDIWGIGPRGEQQQPYLDVGASGLYVRKLWATQIYLQENYTSGMTSGLHGGFHTQVSGLYPASGFNLATKDYVDYMISGIVIPSGGSGSTSLSGLTDVSGTWISGQLLGWDGIHFVPTWISGGGSMAPGAPQHFEIQFTATSSFQVNHNLGAYPQVSVFDMNANRIEVQITNLSTSGLSLYFLGSLVNGKVVCDTAYR